ncbi:hypothetical protein FZ025_05565 [Xanthomonas hyacinthi]|uniref:Uncharacterized protein n=1 Tax=Xanthomonas hyacinthi TaxID=56455 RepID=A0A2S7F3H2_9XANT|nr:hypothetical protein [Xanthomonas hyacinthi]KLD75830.1 hypothetical protein Y886_24740 [Xanthomonas hyacinthi DSM 19077]PPU99982.1 hypothetical protein XhyaCFBP1156_02225 [Xanthomonas hyacinthi]QGY76160.1 hypothetical protein FZ025_05565 [Xanthomonas hyacinthi]
MATEYIVQGTDDKRRNPSANQRRISIAALYLCAGLLIVVVLYPILCSFPKDRTGDGSEYYAMEMAISIEHRPYVQAETWAAYEQLRESGQIRGMQPAADLQAFYQRLTSNGGTDFNHFWFYPVAAAAIGRAGELIGLSHESHAHFMLLHAVLVAGLLLLCAHLHGWRGTLAAAAILFASPALWYCNKVHTELFTAALSTAALACALRQRWAYAGLLLAVVTTQNISFVVPAFVACTIALFAHATSRETRMSLLEVVALTLAPMVALLHPFYYFARFGSFTPQLINGGAQVSDLHILSSLRYIFDPDIGLIPNWPLGLVILAVGLHGVIAKRFPRPTPIAAGFVAIYALAAMTAQAATTNVNSGGTFGPARYGLWYICLFYPLIALLGPLKQSQWSRWLGRATWAIAVLAVVLGMRLAWPAKIESYLTPSRAASLIYGYVPWLWSPTEEVFYERNSGIGELRPTLPALVVGPRCRKALFMPGQESSTLTVYPTGACALTPESGAALIASNFKERPTSPQYFSIDRQALPKAPIFPAARSISVAGLRPYLSEGWSADEPSGVWSLGDDSSLRLRMEEATTEGSRLLLQVNGLWAPKRQSMAIGARVNGGAWQQTTLTASAPQPQQIKIALPELPAGAEVQVELHYDHPASPAQLGMSLDNRVLGIYLISLQLSPSTR